MSSFLALVAVVLLAVPFVVLLRRPGWGDVRESHPDADRLAAEQAAVRSRRSDEDAGPPPTWRPAA